jgi:hypothetical protein
VFSAAKTGSASAHATLTREREMAVPVTEIEHLDAAGARLLGIVQSVRLPMR